MSSLVSEWETPHKIKKSDKSDFIKWLRRHKDDVITPHLIQRAIDEL